MFTIRTKRKIVIVKLDVTKMERFVPLDIKLPSNTVKVTSVMITATKS